MRREAHVPRGGVDGGDGGRGGDIILVADPSRRDLAHLRRVRQCAASDGGPGSRRRSSGADGEPCEIRVPVGTQAFGSDGRKLCDLSTPDGRAVVARGGQGGRGNTHFVSPTRRAPAYAEVGLPGDEFVVELKLKLMADAALAGKPNAGKSSLLARISNARPKVGEYPFTTLAPSLGTIERPDGSQVVVVDVPGLLEGASEGHGMGNEFLPHFERARLLIHTISLEDPDAAGHSFRVIVNELWAYDPRLARLPQIVVLTKRDLVDDDIVELTIEEIVIAADDTRNRRGPVLAIHALSSVSGQGVTAFVQTLFGHTARLENRDHVDVPVTPTDVQLEDYRVYRPRPKRRRWHIYRDRDGLRVTGDRALRTLATAVEQGDRPVEDLVAELERTDALRALRMAGLREGNAVDVCGVMITP